MTSRFYTRPSYTRGLVAFGGVFCLIGIVIFYLVFLRPTLNYFNSRSWVAVPAVIERSGLNWHSDRDGTTYSIAVEYRYEFGGRTYRSDRYDFLRMSSSGRASKEKTLETLRPGMTVTCWVDPKDPAQSVIKRWSNAIWFGLLPLAFFIGGVTFMRSAAMRKFPSLEATDDTGRPQWLPRPQQPADDGSIVFAPASTRMRLFLGLTIFTLFWDGITGYMLVRFFIARENSLPVVFMSLFMIPFVAAGLVLIALSVRQFLALFNPRIRITVDRAEVAPGEVLNLSWQIEGSQNRLKKLCIVFSGEEFATYRRRDDTLTDHHEFAQVSVFESELFGPFGSAKLAIPQDAMHSFKSTNNRITWSLKVRGTIPRWPDIDDKYELVISPRGLIHG